MSVGVLMPCRTPVCYTKPAIESILRQTLKDFELLIIDDDSPVETKEYLASLTDPRVKILVHAQAQGLQNSLNEGLAKLQTRYVFQMHADDIAHPRRLELQMAYWHKHPQLVALGTQIDFIDTNGQLQRQKNTVPCNSEDIHYQLLWSSALNHPTVGYLREEILKIGGYNPRYKSTEDYELWTRLALAGLPMGNTQERLLHYRLHPQQNHKTELAHAADVRALRVAYRAGLTGLSAEACSDYNPALGWDVRLEFYQKLYLQFPAKGADLARRLWRDIRACRQTGSLVSKTALELLGRLNWFERLKRGAW